MIRRVALHHVRVDVDDGAPGAPAAALLRAFPDALPGEPAALRVRLRAAPAPRELPAAGRPSFFHGAVRAVRDGGALVLGDGASLLVVSADGRAIDGEVHATGRDGETFAHTTFLVALVLALRHHGLFHLHAAAVVSPGGEPVLVAGDGGAGKSTVTLALTAAGFDYLGDDAVFLASGAAGPRLLALPRAFHVAPATAGAFPALAPQLGAAYGTTGKRFLDARGAFPGAARMEAGPPRVVLLPRIVDAGRTEIEPIGAAEAVGALLESSALIAVDGASGAATHLALLRDVANGARARRLHLGRDLLRDPVAWAQAITARL